VSGSGRARRHNRPPGRIILRRARPCPGALQSETARCSCSLGSGVRTMAEQISIFTPTSAPPNPSPAEPVHRSSHVRDVRQVDGTRSNPPMSEPQRRWQADQDQLTRENPWRNPDVVISKNADGTLSTRPRTAPASDAPADARAQPGQPQAQPPLGLRRSRANGACVGREKSPRDDAGYSGRICARTAERFRSAARPRVCFRY
jgi:hypothetical protein